MPRAPKMTARARKTNKRNEFSIVLFRMTFGNNNMKAGKHVRLNVGVLLDIVFSFRSGFF